MKPVLTSAVLADLRRPRTYPAISILMPTHRREPDNARDAGVLRNLIDEAKERVQADDAVARGDRFDVLAQLDQIEREVDLIHSQDGLAVFVAPGEHQVWKLSRAVSPRVVLADTFTTRNLVAAQALDRPYWVLALSADHVSLWAGGMQSMSEYTADGFPLTRSLDDPDAERKERIGDIASVFSDEDTRAFLRIADSTVGTVLDGTAFPLFLLGEAEILSIFSDIGGVAKTAVTEIVHGGVARGPASSVQDAVLPAVEAEAEQDVAATMQELDAARGRKLFAAGADEAWEHAAAGRIDRIVVEEHYQVAARVDGGHLSPAEPGEEGAFDDIVDEIIERAQATGATVRFVPDGTLDASGGIAAVLRY